jgi:hypothetical protein
MGWASSSAGAAADRKYEAFLRRGISAGSAGRGISPLLLVEGHAHPQRFTWKEDPDAESFRFAMSAACEVGPAASPAVVGAVSSEQVADAPPAEGA